MSQKIWSAEIVISAVKQSHAKGEKINSYHVQQYRADLYSAGVRYFGTWNKALASAGLLHAVKHRNVWNREIIIQKVLEMVSKGEPINNAYVKANHASLYTSAGNYFGGWAEAVQAAGINYNEVRLIKHRKWSKKHIVAEILKRQAEGLSVSGTLVQKEDVGLYEAAMAHFGERGWSKARVAAGLLPIDPRPGIIYDRQIVVETLQDLHAEGQPLHFAGIKGKEYRNTITAAIRLFGSYPKALKAAGLDYENIRKMRHKYWTPENVMEEIQQLEATGQRLNYAAIMKLYPGLCAAAMRLFGTWGQAVEAAGFSYRKHLRFWSTRAWLLTVESKNYDALLESSTKHAQTRRRK